MHWPKFAKAKIVASVGENEPDIGMNPCHDDKFVGAGSHEVLMEDWVEQRRESAKSRLQAVNT